MEVELRELSVSVSRSWEEEEGSGLIGILSPPLA